jgi:hypothetical protein
MWKAGNRPDRKLSATAALVAALTVLLLVVPAVQAYAGKKVFKGPSSPTGVGNPTLNRVSKPARIPSKESGPPVVPSREPEITKKPGEKGASSTHATPRKIRSSVKSQRKGLIRAFLEPRIDLTPHGLIEDYQRYKPRRDLHTTAAPSPQAPAVVLDHFQELDRNQDSMIDPMERAFSRLDMDRDLDARPRR